MEDAVVYSALLVCFFFTILLFLATRNKPVSASRSPIPPGSLGIPIIGQSIEFLGAMRANRAEEWFYKRVQKYGPVSKFHVFGTPTVFVHGLAANKFIYTSDDTILCNEMPGHVRRLFGERSMIQLNGADHKRMRGALLSFLKPDAIKRSVGRMDEEIRIHLNDHWRGRNQIEAMPLMKKATFNVICSLIFGIERGARRDTLVQHLSLVMEGVVSLPINLPFTHFRKCLNARSRVRDIILEHIHEKRAELMESTSQDSIPGPAAAHEDLITSLLRIREDETNSVMVSDEEIVDNCIVIMMAGYDTTASLLSYLIKLLAENPDVQANILKEHEEIRREKACEEEPLTWEDLGKMKYTWRVAAESLRIITPALSFTRKVLKDIEFEGYLIPKGWQVMWAACMTHRDESIFPDPLKFDPSRFEKEAGIPPYSYIPFGRGQRMCLGYEFARIETLIMIHYLVTGFQWKLSSEHNPFGRDPMPVFYNGLPITIHELKKSVDIVD